MKKLQEEIKTQESIDFSSFPTTRYQGSKRKIVEWIYSNLKELEFDTVLDAFGGSSSVSYLFKKMGKEVTFNDKMKFNYLIGKSLIENEGTRLKENDIIRILTKSSKSETIIQDTFSDYFFTNEENKWLDNTITNIFQFQEYSKNVNELKKSLAFNALFQASLSKRPFNLFHRKNLYLRTNNVKRSFGNKTTWEKDFETQFKYYVDEINSCVFSNGRKCKAINKSIFEIDKVDYDLVYIDPPYIQKNKTNESADYEKCYHFLEGISNYYSWLNNIDYSSSCLKYSTLKKDFFPSNMMKSLSIIFKKFENSTIVISYKKGGVPSIDQIVYALQKLGKKVKTRSLHYSYALNKQNGDKKFNREVLIIGI